MTDIIVVVRHCLQWLQIQRSLLVDDTGDGGFVLGEL